MKCVIIIDASVVGTPPLTSALYHLDREEYMDHDALSALPQTLKPRCEEIATSLAETIHHHSFIPLRRWELHKRLARLVAEIIEFLLADAFDPDAAQAAGATLADLADTQPAVLGRIQIMLAQQLLVGLATEQVAFPHARLASVLGELAIGYNHRLHHTVLAEQESIHQALLTKRQEMEAVLRTERNFSAAVLDTTSALIIVLDHQGRIVRFNRACERTTGYTAEEVLGQRLWDLTLLVSDEREQAKLGFERLHPHQIPVVYENEWNTKCGQRRRIAWLNAVLDDESDTIHYVIGTGVDITDQRQMESDLAVMRRRLAQVQEAERLRFAQDLHDGAVQQLLGISFQVAEMQEHAADHDAPSSQRIEEVIPGLEVVRREIVDVSKLLRRLMADLRPPGLRELGLRGALEVYLASQMCQCLGTMPVVEFDLPLTEPRLAESIKVSLYRVAQEALCNTLKHAQAQHVTVHLHVSDQEVMLRVSDDGEGFQVPTLLHRLAAANHFGLLSLNERVAWVGGQLTIQSRPGQGTEVTVQIPIIEWPSENA